MNTLLIWDRGQGGHKTTSDYAQELCLGLCPEATPWEHMWGQKLNHYHHPCHNMLSLNFYACLWLSIDSFNNFLKFVLLPRTGPWES